VETQFIGCCGVGQAETPYPVNKAYEYGGELGEEESDEQGDAVPAIIELLECSIQQNCYFNQHALTTEGSVISIITVVVNVYHIYESYFPQ